MTLIISGTSWSKIKIYKDGRIKGELTISDNQIEESAAGVELIVGEELILEEESATGEELMLKENMAVEEELKSEQEIVVKENLIGNEKSVDGFDKPLAIDELIDLGFQEKQSENFHQAAECFSRALALNPKPDLAFYLIMDCYSMLNNLGEREFALRELKTHHNTFYNQFNSELRHHFDVWMNKENLNKYFNE